MLREEARYLMTLTGGPQSRTERQSSWGAGLGREGPVSEGTECQRGRWGALEVTVS